MLESKQKIEVFTVPLAGAGTRPVDAQTPAALHGRPCANPYLGGKKKNPKKANKKPWKKATNE
jgi:hypothetical protein